MAAIGLDFSDSSIRVALFQEAFGTDVAKCIIYDNQLNHRCVKPIIAFNDDDDRLIGNEAIRQAEMSPENTLFGIKRIIGRHLNDAVLLEQLKRNAVKYSIENGRVMFHFKNAKHHSYESFNGVEILSIIFEKIKELVEEKFQLEVKMAVIAVPSSFTHNQRQAVIDAATIAGIVEIRLINSSTAAAINFGWNSGKFSDSAKLMVIDFGSSSLDTAVVEMDKHTFKVLSTAGSSSLGGVDIDNRFVGYCLRQIQEVYGYDVSGEARIMQELRMKCDEAKISLQSTTNAVIHINTPFNGNYLQVAVSREELESITNDLLESAMTLVRKVFDDTVSKNDIDELILVGGSTRLIKFQEMLEDFFGIKLNKSLNQNEAAVFGAALYAAKLNGADDCNVAQLSIIEVSAYNVSLSVPGWFTGEVTSRIVFGSRQQSLPFVQAFPVLFTYDHQSTLLIFVGDSRNMENYEYLTTLGVIRWKGLKPYSAVSVQLRISESGIFKFTVTELNTGRHQLLETIDYNRGFYIAEIENMKENIKNHKLKMKIKKELLSCKHEYERELSEIKKRFRETKEATGDKFSDIEAQLKMHINWFEKKQRRTMPEYSKKKEELKQIMKCIESLLQKD